MKRNASNSPEKGDEKVSDSTEAIESKLSVADGKFLKNYWKKPKLQEYSQVCRIVQEHSTIPVPGSVGENVIPLTLLLVWFESWVQKYKEVDRYPEGQPLTGDTHDLDIIPVYRCNFIGSWQGKVLLPGKIFFYVYPKLFDAVVLRILS